jgi:hypothetical protein
MTNFYFHPTSNFGRVFCRYGFKEKHFYYTNPFYKYPLSLQLVLEPTISSLLHTLAIKYMLIILTWEFFINFSFSIVPQLFYKFRKTNLVFC